MISSRNVPCSHAARRSHEASLQFGGYKFSAGCLEGLRGAWISDGFWGSGRLRFRLYGFGCRACVGLRDLHCLGPESCHERISHILRRERAHLTERGPRWEISTPTPRSEGNGSGF